jgi:hypothetical protein
MYLGIECVYIAVAFGTCAFCDKGITTLKANTAYDS